MKSQTFKGIAFAVAVTSILATSCNKTELKPSSDNATSDLSAQERNAGTMTTSSLLTPISISGGYNPVYGVSQYNTLYSVDPATGIQTSLGFMSFGGGAEFPVNVTGIALSTNTATPNSYVVTSAGNNPCLMGSGTTFFLGTLPSPSLVRMGTVLGRTITDVEYNPIDGFLYGIEGNTIVKILSLGTGCTTGVSAVAPVVTTMGTMPAELGAGPYGLAFNYPGQCNIVSAKSHMRAIVNFTSPLTVAAGTLFQGVPTDMVNPLEIGCCMSKVSLLISTKDQVTSSSIDLSYYQFGTSSAGVVGSWIEKSNNSLADYTSKPQSNTIIKEF